MSVYEMRGVIIFFVIAWNIWLFLGRCLCPNDPIFGIDRIGGKIQIISLLLLIFVVGLFSIHQIHPVNGITKADVSDVYETYFPELSNMDTYDTFSVTCDSDLSYWDLFKYAILGEPDDYYTCTINYNTAHISGESSDFSFVDSFEKYNVNDDMLIMASDGDAFILRSMTNYNDDTINITYDKNSFDYQILDGNSEPTKVYKEAILE